MRTTLDIDAELIKKVMKATGAPSRSKAVEMAMREFLHTRHREELSKLIGNYQEFGLSLKDLEKMRVDS